MLNKATGLNIIKKNACQIKILRQLRILMVQPWCLLITDHINPCISMLFHLHGGLPLDTLSSQSENVSNELRRKKKLQTQTYTERFVPHSQNMTKIEISGLFLKTYRSCNSEDIFCSFTKVQILVLRDHKVSILISIQYSVSAASIIHLTFSF